MMTVLVRCSAVLLVLMIAVASVAAGPAEGTLVTRWAAQVSAENVLPEYPRPQMVRVAWLNLNGAWQAELNRAAESVPAGVELPEKVLVPFPIESTLSGVKKHAERVWYRRTFEVPDAWKGQHVLLHFGAVDWEATVYLNGKKLGTHRGGYDGFSFDITDAMRSPGPQELLVHVYDPTDVGDQPRGKQVLKLRRTRYTPTTGIWQTVWLEPVPAAHIDRLVLVPDVSQSCLRLTVEGAGASTEEKVEAVVRNGKEEVARAKGAVGKEIVVAIPKDRQKLWSPDSPFLYDVDVKLVRDGRTVDSVSSYFGLRKIDMAKDSQGVVWLRLNGERVFQVGPLDQGFWPDGLYTAPTDEALRYDIEVTKQLGFNMTRKHVKVEPARWYYWCDKLGLLVWQDMPNGNNTTPASHEQFETELRRMIGGLQNHPSIIMWVVFNEGWGQHDTARYAKLVKSLDPSRLVDSVSGWKDENVGDVLDIHKYPGPDAPVRDPSAPAATPPRAVVLGEFGGLGLSVAGHQWADKHWGYREMSGPEELLKRYVALLGEVYHLKKSRGLAAAVYTQITDVETECNGLLTYDRAVIKVDPKIIAAANRGESP